jgi:hypothetical protein
MYFLDPLQVDYRDHADLEVTVLGQVDVIGDDRSV